MNQDANSSGLAPEEYDFVIIGTGAGAKLAAWTFAAEGKRVAAIERRYIGGACPNVACLPSKNVIHTAQVASYMQRSDEFGIARQDFRVDMSVVRDRKRRMVSGMLDVHLAEFRKSGTELILGSARFAGPRMVEVTLREGGRRLLRGTHVIIGTGTHAAVEPIPGLVEAQPLTHIEALELDKVPEHVIVIGGGYVGLEFAQAMRRFGSRVTVIDRNPRLLHREDEDVSAALSDLFEDDGIAMAFNAQITRVSGTSGQSVKVAIEQDGAEHVLQGSHLMVATGRVPNTKDLQVELAGVELTPRGYIKVNERLETTAPGVWAVGEVAGSPQFTHISEDDFRVVYDNISGRPHVTTGRQVPFCLFTDPELAHIGLSEKEAKAQGIAYRLFKAPMAAVQRASALMETRGFLKALVGADHDRILGFTAFGVSAGETLATVQVAMIAGLPWTALRDAVFAHPTMAEGLHPLFSSPPSAPVVPAKESTAALETV
ncbi:MAG TPA: FAD-dependent oxidoreductase [Acidobacteriaceae bacterium]